VLDWQFEVLVAVTGAIVLGQYNWRLHTSVVVVMSLAIALGFIFNTAAVLAIHAVTDVADYRKCVVARCFTPCVVLHATTRPDGSRLSGNGSAMEWVRQVVEA
jgi:hypothetical protein